MNLVQIQKYVSNKALDYKYIWQTRTFWVWVSSAIVQIMGDNSDFHDTSLKNVKNFLNVLESWVKICDSQTFLPTFFLAGEVQADPL